MAIVAVLISVYSLVEMKGQELVETYTMFPFDQGNPVGPDQNGHTGSVLMMQLQH